MKKGLTLLNLLILVSLFILPTVVVLTANNITGVANSVKFAELTPSFMARHCRLDSSGRRILSAAVQRLSLSARGYDRVRKVARTIADLEGSENIQGDHVAEALQFR